MATEFGVVASHGHALYRLFSNGVGLVRLNFVSHLFPFAL